MTLEELERELRHLATKEDLALLRAELHKELSGMHKEIGTMHEVLGNQLKWMIGLLIAQTGVLITVLHK